MTVRGIVLGLSLEQTAARAKQLGDPSFVAGYYRMDHAGGSDPTAPDPFARWQFPDKNGVMHGAITAECIAGAAWSGGWDRFQPVRFAHLYDGSINCNSMLLDANGPAKCFVIEPEPIEGCYVVAPTGVPGFEECGHILTMHTVPARRWDIDDITCWRGVLGTDIASRGSSRANTTHDITWWFAARHHGAKFVRSIMQP